jgi:hypothetical protein
LADERIPNCVRRQQIVSEIFPEAQSSRCFEVIAEKIKRDADKAKDETKSKRHWSNVFKREDESD